MKANELMAGDFARVWEDGLCIPKNTVVKIRAIDEINSLVLKSGKRLTGSVHCQSAKNAFFSGGIWVDYLEPIPLTGDILEKNGFEKIQIHGEKQDDIFQCYDGEIIIEVGIYDPNFILIHYHYETPDGIHSGELSSIVKVDGGKFYLHELQHALRLCGINKEIEL